LKNLRFPNPLSFFLFFLTLAVTNSALGLPEAQWPPPGEKIVLHFTRDTWLSSVGDERHGSNGGAEKLKLKGNQEYFLFDIDPTILLHKIITGALLHIRSASPRKGPLLRLGISTLASRWVEGTSKNYRRQTGSASFLQARQDKQDWAYPGSNLLDVIFGRGHTLWKFADCTQPDTNGWQTCAVDPDVISARVADISHGFCGYDEVGNEWRIKRNKFEYQYLPNRFLYSRESGKNIPWLEVWTSGTDTIPPDAISDISEENIPLQAGEALLTWESPEDHGGGKTIGFLVSYKDNEKIKQFPRYMIPLAGAAGEKVLMHIQDLNFNPGKILDVTIKPVDSAGNIGLPYTQKIKLSSSKALTFPAGKDLILSPAEVNLPEVKGLKVGVADLLDKVNPQTGQMVPPRNKGYLGGNHIFSAPEKLIRLQAARNETVDFQLVLNGKADDIKIQYDFQKNPLLHPRIYQFAYVKKKNKKGKLSTYLPDPLVPLKDSFTIPSNAGKVIVPKQKYHSLLLELYIPHNETPGLKKGRVTVLAGGEMLALDVELTVWDFTLPNKLSFVPEMNAYGTVYPFNDYKYYRLAHEHRTCINYLTYGWHGLPTLAPEWDGNDFDWTDWDKEVTPLLNGTAFNDLPRKGEPVDVFYLPFSENWPVDIFKHYQPSYWADEAFSDPYAEELKKAFASFSRHINEKGWHETTFQFYLNNKVYNRGRFDKSSAPWIFDEPINTQDFWALRWYGLLWHSAVNQIQGSAKLWYRADISFSQFSRDILLGITNVEYLGGNNFQKTRMKYDENILWGQSYFAEYGSANNIEDSNMQPTLWCISSWAKGAIGVLPWQTIGDDSSWFEAKQTSLFYPSPDGPLPSVRLKAFTRGQQDVEYLTFLETIYHLPRFGIKNWLQKEIKINDTVSKKHEQDAGTALFTDVSPFQLWKLRYQLALMISKTAPRYRRTLVHHKKPTKEIKYKPDVEYVNPAPPVKRVNPQVDSFQP
jgi:hypothetical protein